MNTKSKDFFAHTGFNLVASVFTVVVGFATSAILARTLGKELFGTFAVILLFPATLMAIFASGFTSTVTYSVASKKWEEDEIVPSILGIGFYLTLIMLVAAAVVLSLQGLIFPDADVRLLACSLIWLPIFVLLSAFQCLLVGKQLFRQKMKLVFATGSVRLAIYAGVLYLFPRRLDLALLVFILSDFLSLAIFYSYWAKKGPIPKFFHRPKFDLFALKKSLLYGGYAQLANLAGFLNYKIDQVIIFWLVGDASLGIYVIAVGLAEKLWLLVGNLSSVLFSLTAGNDVDKKSHNIAARVAAIVLWFNLGSAVLLALVAERLIHWVYTAEYAEAVFPIYFLLPGVVALGFGKVISNYLAGIGRPDLNAAAATTGVIINVAANLILIPSYGLIGAAISTSISYTVVTAICYISFLRLTGLSCFESFIPKRRDLQKIGEFALSKLKVAQSYSQCESKAPSRLPDKRS